MNQDLTRDSEAVLGRPICECGLAGQNFAEPSQVVPTAANAADCMTDGRQKLRFLVVEDMAELADLLVHSLGVLGIEAEIASTGKAALQRLSSGSFDAVLVDIELPDANGFQVVDAANASGWLRKTHIVFCTGSRSEEYRQRAARFSGSSFLWKPFSMQDLVNCVEGVPALGVNLSNIRRSPPNTSTL